MAEYLDLTGIISFGEFARSLAKNGKVKSQLRAIQAENFPQEPLKKIMVESVRVEVEANGLRILPSLRTVRVNPDTEPLSYVKHDHGDSTAPPVPARASSLCKVSTGTSLVQDRITRLQAKNQKNPVLNFLKSRASQKHFLERKTAAKKSPRKCRKPKEETHSDQETEIQNLQKSLRGIVARKKEKLGCIANDRRRKNVDKRILQFSAGYRWERDFDSTDDESLWDRLSTVFSERRWSASNKSVTSGDYCIHDND